MGVFVQMNTWQKLFSFVDQFSVISNNNETVAISWCKIRYKNRENGKRNLRAHTFSRDNLRLGTNTVSKIQELLIFCCRINIEKFSLSQQCQQPPPPKKIKYWRTRQSLCNATLYRCPEFESPANWILMKVAFPHHTPLSPGQRH